MVSYKSCDPKRKMYVDTQPLIGTNCGWNLFQHDNTPVHKAEVGGSTLLLYLSTNFMYLNISWILLVYLWLFDFYSALNYSKCLHIYLTTFLHDVLPINRGVQCLKWEFRHLLTIMHNCITCHSFDPHIIITEQVFEFKRGDGCRQH